MAEQKSAVEKSLRSASRSVSIHLSNYTTNILINPQVFTESGYCCGAPQPTVEKGAIATCSFAKKIIGTCGAVGILSYDITEDRKTKAVERLVIMFSVPFNDTVFKNLCSLGMFDISQDIDEDLYKRMYYKKALEFERGRGSGSEIRYEGKYYTLTGTMSSGGNAEIRVELRNKD